MKAGETVALVGASGAGKTTLINLIPRFWIPSSGEIYFDGIAQSTVTLKSLRAQISLVSQDVILLMTRLRQTLLMATRKQLESKLKKQQGLHI